MLGFAHGKIISKSIDSNHCVIRTGDIGYEITVSKKVYESLATGETYSVWLHTHVREDQITLFGFLTETEKTFFRVLLSVSGLGPKTALSLLSEHGAEHLSQLILAKNVSEIATAPGVGKKLAERLVLELSSKLEKLTWVTQLEVNATANKASKKPKSKELKDDLSSALSHLGYQPQQIKITLEKMFDSGDQEKLGFESCLKAALKEMSGHRLTTSEASHG